MRPRLGDLLLGAILGACLLFAGLGWYSYRAVQAALATQKPAILKPYRVKFGEDKIELRADRIDVKEGCVLFYRGDTLDTIICEPMGQITVTELNEP